MDSLILSFLNAYSGYIKKTLPRIKDLHLNGDNITAKVTRNNLFNTLLFLKHDWLHQAKLCLDVTSYDQPGKILRFSVIYSLESTEYNSRYQVYTQTDPYLGLETITSIYSSANWSEREVWDFFGIIFWNHPDLRRILTDYGFDGYPLRKDFPLTGYVEKIYSHTDKVVVDRGVELSQELRSYKYEDTWINEQQ